MNITIPEERARNEFLPWTERFRPKKLSEIISHTHIVTTLQQFIKNRNLPHLLFYGPPGTGKTSTIMACCQELYGSYTRAMVIHLNASDDRGIDVVRQQIKEFANTRSFVDLDMYKLVILDEADSMTEDAQLALRQIIASYTKNTRFCLICNYLSRIIPTLQSRFVILHFSPIQLKQLQENTINLLKREKIKYTLDGLDAAYFICQGDARKYLNVLQASYSSHQCIDAQHVYLCTNKPSQNDILFILHHLLHSSVREGYEQIHNLIYHKGMALVDILQQLSLCLLSCAFPNKMLSIILQKMSQIEVNIANSCSEDHQLYGLVGSFVIARNYEIKN